jgi:hypothetical protein
MPIFEITDPNTGQVLELEGDSPPSEQELEQIFASQRPAQQPEITAQPVEQPPATFAQALVGQAPADPRLLEAMGATTRGELAEREKTLAALTPRERELIEQQNPLEAFLIGAGRGFKTLERAVGLEEPETPFEKQAIKQIEAQQPIAVTSGEIAGESAPFLVPGLGISAIPARTGQVLATGSLGALEAGLITRGRGADEEKQLQAAGIGGAIAGGLELALPVIGRISGKIIRRSLGKAPKGAVIDSAGNPSDELLEALQESGQSFDDIVKEAREELAGEAVEPREAARKAFLESQGLDPTRAQISRNAADFQTQQEAAKTSNRVRDALEKQEATLTSRFDNAVLETGGKSSSPTVSVVDALTEKATKLDQEIGDLYRAARQTAPEAKNIRFNKLTETLKQLEGADRRAGGNISAIIGDMQSKGILDRQKKVIGKIGIETAEDLRKLTNELYDPANPFGNMLLRQVKDSLDDDVFNAAGKDFFKQARQAKASFEKDLTRAKISKFDSRKSNLVRDLLENKIDPDLMVDKVVFGKAWRHSDLRQLKEYISTNEAGKAAFDDMRAEVMQKIKDKTFIGPADEAGFQALSRDKLQKAIETVGRKKLNVLFTPQENKFLRDMLQVAKLREPVRGTALGRGPSAQAIGRLESAIRQNPIARVLLETVSLDAQGRAVLKAKPTPIKLPSPRPAVAPLAVPAAVAATQQEQQ